MLTFRVMLSLPDRLRTVSVRRHDVGAERRLPHPACIECDWPVPLPPSYIVVPVDSLVSRLDEWEQG
jgi:hypothetical protein